MANYLLELEQEPFDAEEFVERLAHRATTSRSVISYKQLPISPGAEKARQRDLSDDFDPVVLQDTFEEAIRDLKILHETIQLKCDRLEIRCKEEEKTHWQKVKELQNKNKAAFNSFQELDERINFVATKVVHLGDQLESVNTPRARAVEAQKLINYFAEFFSPGPVISEVFTDESQLSEAADVIQKLNLISQELPGDKFEIAKKKIAVVYNQTERALIKKFAEAQMADNIERMKEIAGILSHFKGYNHCADAFIEQSQMNAFNGQDIFKKVIPLCHHNETIMKKVFTNPEQVMARFILIIYHGALQDHIKAQLADMSNSEVYLKNLYDLYFKTDKLSKDLTAFDMGNDNTFLSKLTKHIFQRYLDSYISVETRNLRDKCSNILQRYYDSKNHQKKPTGGMKGLVTNFQMIGNKVNVNIGTPSENYGSETFLSEDVCIIILQETKVAFRRCQLLSRQSDLPSNAAQILDILIQHLCAEYIDYALELGIQSIPTELSKNTDLYFFDIVKQCNVIMHLMEKQFNDSLVPLVVSTPRHGDCLQRKKRTVELMENKLDLGLDRTLSAVISYVKHLLQTEQKKAYFKPECVDQHFLPVASSTCNKVVAFIDMEVEKIKDSLDGKNVEAVLLELGSRFHRVLYEHFQQFQYSFVGTMLVICDIKQYKMCIEKFNIAYVNSLFDTLQALCNLLVVVPENLKKTCNGEELRGVDRSEMINFVQLRADRKIALGALNK